METGSATIFGDFYFDSGYRDKLITYLPDGPFVLEVIASGMSALPLTLKIRGE